MDRTEQTQLKKDLKERCAQFNITAAIMEGREKGDQKSLFGNIVTITDYEFLTDGETQREYAVFTIKEDDKRFYFGGQVLTDNLKDLEADGYHEVVVAEGLPVLFNNKISKSKRSYTTVTLFP